MRRIALIVGIVGALFRAHGEVEKAIALPYFGCGLALSVHYVISEPQGVPVRGDILFLHGLGDAAENHAPLFKMWNESGFRVIAVDLPSHGRTTGASLNWSSFSGLAKYLADFLAQPKIRPDANRPLLISGWSTGGLIAVRLIQKKALSALPRQVDGLILFAPGISVKTLPGEWGRITQRTLTRRPDPAHVLPINPTSPFWYPAFAVRLKINSWLAQLQSLPTDLPTLVLLADSVDDRYINTDRTRDWFEKQIRRGAQVWGYQYPGAYHELDNEVEAVAERVKLMTQLFASSVVMGTTEYILDKPGIRVLSTDGSSPSSIRP